MIEITTINCDSPLYSKVCELKERILRVPLGLVFSEEDKSLDKVSTQIIALIDKNTPVGCVSLMQWNENDLSIGRVTYMAIDSHMQGQGVGKILMNDLEKIAKLRGYRFLRMNARCSAIPFYNKLGYKVYGEEFMRVSIPHIIMEKQI